VFGAAIVDRRQYWQGEQRKLEQDIKRMGKASKAQNQKLQAVRDKLKELDSVEFDVARGLRSLDFFQWHLHFNDVFQQKGGFDVVIGNPPYVRQEKLSEQFKGSLKIEFPDLHKGTADIYTYFYGKGVELLRANGQLAFITSNKWFRANYGVNLRKYLAEGCQVHNITDFGELPVFDAATFPMIFVGQKGKLKPQETLFTQVKSLELPYPNVRAIIQEQGTRLPFDALNGENWTLSDEKYAIYLKKIEASGVPLKDYVQNQIYRGVLTGFNEAFVIDEEKRNELIERDPKSAELIKPLAVGNDIRKWRIESQKKWLIVTPIGVKIQEYPAIFNHLKKWQANLEKRCDKGNHWWELRSCNYYEKFEQPKIIFPDITKESRFTFDTDGFYSGNTAYIIPVADLYLLGVLNSKTIWEYAQHTFSCLGDPLKGGRFRFIYQSVSRIPIPDAPSFERQAISALVQKCLDVKGQNVSHLEAEINNRVAHLYGLTPEEIKIIEGGQS